jgi:hypothetical protein
VEDVHCVLGTHIKKNERASQKDYPFLLCVRQRTIGSGIKWDSNKKTFYTNWVMKIGDKVAKFYRLETKKKLERAPHFNGFPVI